jgi:hypothetical protein
MMGGMNAIIGFGRRFGRTYWNLNERAWLWLRRFDRPLIVLAVLGSAVAWVIAVHTNNYALLAVPNIVALAYWIAVILDR